MTTSVPGRRKRAVVRSGLGTFGLVLPKPCPAPGLLCGGCGALPCPLRLPPDSRPLREVTRDVPSCRADRRRVPPRDRDRRRFPRRSPFCLPAMVPLAWASRSALLLAGHGRDYRGRHTRLGAAPPAKSMKFGCHRFGLAEFIGQSCEAPQAATSVDIRGFRTIP